MGAPSPVSTAGSRALTISSIRSSYPSTVHMSSGSHASWNVEPNPGSDRARWATRLSRWVLPAPRGPTNKRAERSALRAARSMRPTASATRCSRATNSSSRRSPSRTLGVKRAVRAISVSARARGDPGPGTAMRRSAPDRCRRGRGSGPAPASRGPFAGRSSSRATGWPVSSTSSSARGAGPARSRSSSRSANGVSGPKLFGSRWRNAASSGGGVEAAEDVVDEGVDVARSEGDELSVADLGGHEVQDHGEAVAPIGEEGDRIGVGVRDAGTEQQRLGQPR